jgi:hypothetical protein
MREVTFNSLAANPSRKSNPHASQTMYAAETKLPSNEKMMPTHPHKIFAEVSALGR